MSRSWADNPREGFTIRSLCAQTSRSLRQPSLACVARAAHQNAMTRDPRLTLNARQQELLEWVQRDGFVTVEDLAAHFDVTPQTIRRDVNWLADMNLLRRYHGGASLPTSSENVSYTARQRMFHEEKRRIAALVATHIPDQASLFINLGTTTEEVARALNRHRGLRVITNNLNVASMMSGYPDCEVLVTGGIVRPWDKGIVGELAIDFIRQFKVDFAIIGTSSIEPDGTLRDFDTREVRVAEAIIEHARTAFLTADHSKFGRPALVRQGHLNQIDALFTDAPPPAEMDETLASAGIQVYVAT
ncbi:transcriptional regulator, DeoR family [Paraburkholderia megapolitana]|uniref:Transcriptional regulator, DeoR family n=2 Tax=Paraburkholderia megapolitana TaxID=420953 RepID=A0A1I3I9T1_9BURK|nr:transcriptional regulator, DeoR family [Paraburkholderia megapolitana]